MTAQHIVVPLPTTHKMRRPFVEGLLLDKVLQRERSMPGGAVVKPYRGYIIGSHKLRGRWFAYGWVAGAQAPSMMTPRQDRLVFVSEVASREEAERRAKEEIDRLLKQEPGRLEL